MTAWKTPTFTCRQGKSDGLEDECVHHQHLETPSVWDDEPVALRGEDGSDTGWESLHFDLFSFSMASLRELL